MEPAKPAAGSGEKWFRKDSQHGRKNPIKNLEKSDENPPKNRTEIQYKSNTNPIKVQQKTFDTLPSPSSLREPGKTSLSIITPPEITKQILKEARDAGVKAVWLQPGSFGADELAYAEREFPGAAVGGFGDGTVGGEGWCVLVDGEKALREAKRVGEEKL